MKYQKIIQEPYCCVGACLEMILNRYHIQNKGQKEIACELGLIIPRKYQSQFKNAIIGKKPNAGYGTQIQKTEYSINHFFQKNKINLKEEYKFLTEVSEVKEFLIKNKEKDIMICCHAETLYNDPKQDWGHMILFETIESNNTVIILDPSKEKNREKITLKTLTKAVSIHGYKNGAGFYLIETREI